VEGLEGRAIAYNAGMAATSAKELAAAAAGGSARNRGLYDRDFWGWTQEQAAALGRRDFEAIDWDNVIEEVETLGRAEKRAWKSHCTNVISHLLKIERAGRPGAVNHWRKEIEIWRAKMYRTLSDNPGMKGELAAMLAEAWGDGRRDAVRALAEHNSPDDAAQERRLRISWEARLPAECPYALADIAGYDPFGRKARPSIDVWPAPVARRLNEVLGTDYPVRRRAPEREEGLSR